MQNAPVEREAVLLGALAAVAAQQAALQRSQAAAAAAVEAAMQVAARLIGTGHTAQHEQCSGVVIQQGPCSAC